MNEVFWNVDTHRTVMRRSKLAKVFICNTDQDRNQVLFPVKADDLKVCDLIPALAVVSDKLGSPCH